MAEITMTATPATAFRRSCLQRLQGPGGLYNIANLTGFLTGILVVALASETREQGLVTFAIWDHVAGRPSAAALTLSLGIFLLSGEMYHRGWACRPIDAGRVRLADALAGLGALIMFVPLMLLGEVWLALVSTALLATAKFGSAAMPRASCWVSVGRFFETDPFRAFAILSRLPAILALVIGLSTMPTDSAVLIQQIVLLMTYGLRVRADCFLLRASVSADAA